MEAAPRAAQLSSLDLGREWQAELRLPMNEKLYLLGVAGLAQPGEAIRAAGGRSNWTAPPALLFGTF